MQNILFDMLCFISAHTQDQSVFQEQLPHMTEKEVRDTYRRLFLSESHSNQSQKSPDRKAAIKQDCHFVCNSPQNTILSIIFCDRFNEVLAVQYRRVLDRSNQCQIFCHFPRIRSYRWSLFPVCPQIPSIPDCHPVLPFSECPCPCKDRCDRVCGSLFPFRCL